MVDGDTYKTTLEWRYTDVDVAVQNVLYFRQFGDDSTPGYVPELDLGNRIKLVWNAGSGPGDFRGQYISPSFSFLNVRVQPIWPAETLATVTPVNVAGSGVDAGANIPSVCAMLVRLQALSHTRTGMGRIYLGGFAANRNALGADRATTSHGYWSASYTTFAGIWFQAVWDACKTANAHGVHFDMGVWSRVLQGPTRPGNDGFSPLVSFAVQSAVRVQRRREVGVGI